MSVWQITSVDTMKDSMDTCYPVANQLSQAVIAQGVNLAAQLNTTHITVDVYYDYPDYMTLWVEAVRSAGKSVWFRCHWNAWEGNNGVSASLTTAQYLSNTIAYIQAHPTLFASGDILDACPEPDNSPYWNTTYGANWTNGAPTAATNAFNQFLLDLDTQLQSTLQALGIYGVNTSVRSLNSFWAKSIAALYPATVAALGVVCMDSYPEGSSTDPTTCANARLAEVQQVATARPGVPILISEMGYSNAVAVTDAQQDAVLQAELAALITVPTLIGTNYWVAQGTDTSGGYTHLFAGNRGAWTLRPAAYTLSTYYRKQLDGWVDASHLSVSIGGTAVTLVSGSLQLDGAIAQRSTCNFSVHDQLGTLRFVQGQVVSVDAVVDGVSRHLYGGIVASSKRSMAGNIDPYFVHDVTCADWHYLADKRVVATSYANKTCGAMVEDIVANYLAAEGVTYSRGVNHFTAQQSDVEAADVSAFSPGSTVTISQDTTQAWHGSGSLKAITSGGTHTFEQVEVHTSALVFAAAQQVTISMYAKVASGTATLRFFLQSDTGAIGGTTTITLTTTWQRFTWTATLPNPFTNTWIGLRWDTGGTAQAITVYMDGMQIEIGAAATAWELGGLPQSVQDGPTVTSYVVNYKTAAATFDDLAQLAGFIWWIDANKVAWFVAPSATPAPWPLDTDKTDLGTISLEDSNPLYRNGQWLLGVKDVTATQTEQRKGDGTTTAFLMSYPLHSVPTITVNGVAQTVGIQGIDTGKAWYWSKGDNTISQDSGGTKLVATDTLQVVYVGEWNTIIYSEDSGEITAELALEGAGTGLVEAVTTDTSIATAAQGFQSVAALLQRYAQAGQTLQFFTRTGDLAPGQLLTVTLPAPWNVDAEQFLIQDISTTADDYWFGYTVKALQGPVSDTWVQWLDRISNKQSVIDTTSQGTAQTVSVLQTGAAAWTWTVTGSATVNSLLIPQTTLYPSTTLYPGTAGTPVAITWTKTNAALNAWRDLLSGAKTDGLKVGYLAWGTGTQGTPATATQLGHEVGRKAITSITTTATPGEDIINGYLSPSDANGVAITEVAFFAGPGANAGANSGVMLLYGAYSHTKTNQESIQIQADSTIA